MLPEQTRITGSPEQTPIVEVHGDEVPVVLLHPIVYVRPGEHESVPLTRQLHSREVPAHELDVHATVGLVVGTSGGPASVVVVHDDVRPGATQVPGQGVPPRGPEELPGTQRPVPAKEHQPQPELVTQPPQVLDSHVGGTSGGGGHVPQSLGQLEQLSSREAVHTPSPQ